MNKTAYFSLWGGMFILCAGLGFIPESAGFLKFLLVALAVGFFVIPMLLVRQAGAEEDKATVKLVRNLAALSLGLTVAALLANFLCFMSSEAVGTFLYVLLVIVSAPMFCGQYWVLSLFLWAFVMFYSIAQLRKMK